MTLPFDPSHDLTTASDISALSGRRNRLPRWYAALSTAVFLFGVFLMTVGVFVGWFLPFLGAMVLTTNVVLFPVLLATWRARGVIPRSGRLVQSRYWRVAPIVVPVALVLGLTAFVLAPEQRIWTWIAVVIPFAFEQAYRLKAWTQR